MTNEPQAAPNGWAIDTSTGTPILTYEACSVIQDEQAHLVMDLLGRVAEPQAAPLVPPMPKYRDDPAATGMDVDWRYTHNLEKWGRQCAEIAQAQARRAEKAESAIQDVHSALGNEIAHEGVRLKAMRVRSERDALKARVAELERDVAEAQAKQQLDERQCDEMTLYAGELAGTLAQRDREVLALREKMRPAVKLLESVQLDLIIAERCPSLQLTKAIRDCNSALASTAQAGAEAERRIREDKRGKMTVASRDVLAERLRQIEAEGWTPEHDDHHPGGVMASAAACYAAASRQVLRDGTDPEAICAPGMWPWDRHWWKPAPVRRMLVKAGALILAEIERLDRAAILGTGGEAR